MYLIKVGNHIINADNLATVCRVPSGGGDTSGVLMCDLVGGGKLTLTGEDAEKVWKWLSTYSRDLEVQNEIRVDWMDK